MRIRRRLIAEDSGQGLAEYGLILGLIAVVCVAAVTLLGTQIQSLLTAIANLV